MEVLREKEEAPCLDTINHLMFNEPTFRSGFSVPLIELSSNYHYVPTSELSLPLQHNLAPLMATTQAEGFLLPRQGSASALSLMPTQGALSELFKAAARGVSYSAAISIVPVADVLRLCTLGMLAVRLSSGTVSGPAAQLLLTVWENKSLPEPRHTDSVSEAAVNHAVRLPIIDTLSLTERLYSYNSEPLFDSDLLSHSAHQVKELVETAFGSTSVLRPSPPDNPGWYMFQSVAPAIDCAELPQHYKLYLSPVVRDLPRCLARLATVLPRLRFQAWKVGRFTYGISRPDKICLYFSSLSDAQFAAQMLAPEMQDIDAQGVPFTARQDKTGLISLAMDPPRQTARSAFSSQNSWRLWVSRKIATAIIMAKQSPDYPLSPLQSALWTMQFLGVEPETWHIHNSHFWRN